MEGQPQSRRQEGRLQHPLPQKLVRSARCYRLYHLSTPEAQGEDKDGYGPQPPTQFILSWNYCRLGLVTSEYVAGPSLETLKETRPCNAVWTSQQLYPLGLMGH